jgi:hypothetical protein
MISHVTSLVGQVVQLEPHINLSLSSFTFELRLVQKTHILYKGSSFCSSFHFLFFNLEK